MAPVLNKEPCARAHFLYRCHVGFPALVRAGVVESVERSSSKLPREVRSARVAAAAARETSLGESMPRGLRFLLRTHVTSCSSATGESPGKRPIGRLRQPHGRRASLSGGGRDDVNVLAEMVEKELGGRGERGASAARARDTPDSG